MNKNCRFKCNITRMHSSRMRTARVLTVSLSMLCGGGCTWSRGGVPGQGVYLVLGGVPGPRGVCCQGVYLVPGGCSGSWGVYLVPGGSAPKGCTWSWWGLLQGGCTWSGGVPCPRGVYLVPGGVPGPGGVCSGGMYLVPGGYQVLPTVNRITHTCKNITLPQLCCGRLLGISTIETTF